jgi:hypothetical protein
MQVFLAFLFHGGKESWLSLLAAALNMTLGFLLLAGKKEVDDGISSDWYRPDYYSQLAAGPRPVRHPGVRTTVTTRASPARPGA